MHREVVVDAAERLAEIAVVRLERAAAEAIERRGRFALGLPGGSVAEAFFPRFVRSRVDLARSEFFWVDERAAPIDDAESNAGLARRLWLAPAGVAPERQHPWEIESASPVALDSAARAAESSLLERLGDPPRLDLALLGVGADGHVASLFPGHRLLHEEGRWVAALDDAPKPPPARLTLTMPALLAARLLVVAAYGEAKAAAVASSFLDRDSTLPLALLLRRAEAVVLLLDRAAASVLVGTAPRPAAS